VRLFASLLKTKIKSIAKNPRVELLQQYNNTKCFMLLPKLSSVMLRKDQSPFPSAASFVLRATSRNLAQGKGGSRDK